MLALGFGFVPKLNNNWQSRKNSFLEKINTRPRVLLPPQIFNDIFLKADGNIQVQIQSQYQKATSNTNVF